MRYHQKESCWLYCNLPTAMHVCESGRTGWIAFHEHGYEFHRVKLNRIK